MHSFLKKAAALVTLCILAPGIPAQSQQPAAQDDVIRVNTQLVQTEAMVFDRQGRFVSNLTADQFELFVNGEQRTLSFFDQIVSGTAREKTQLAAARGNSNAPDLSTGQFERGRLLFFFLDDVHLSPASLARARTALSAFVENQMNLGDQVAIVSTSGQIGFLQQLTDNPAVLRAAIARLAAKPTGDGYTGKTQISEYLASQVFDYGNRELFAALLESTKVEQQMGPGSRHGDHGLAASYSGVPYLRNRLRQVNDQSRLTTQSTLEALEGLIDSSSELPGRKTVFFLSDGFLVNERKAGALELLQRITRKAAASGVIFYTMDARGTTFNLGSSVDASSNDYWDASARRAGLASGEIHATREPLKLIADETGGRAFFDSNGIDQAIRQTIDETSRYYLLAWRPGSAADIAGKRQMRLSIKNHPELTVRWRSDFGSSTTGSSKTKTADSSSNADPDRGLQTAIRSTTPKRALPVGLSVGYISSAEGEQLRVSMQIERQFLQFKPEQDRSDLDVLGVVLNDRGEPASFKQVVTVGAKTDPGEDAITWNSQMHVPPGIYQVRVAVRERSSGLMGSAMQWIQVPNLAEGISLSSIFLGERNPSALGSKAITVDVDHRFARSSILRFQTYVYNPSARNGASNVWIDAKLLSNRRQVMALAPAKVPDNAGPSLPYWAEISLAGLRPGHYMLQLSASDRSADRTASQYINFTIE